MQMGEKIAIGGLEKELEVNCPFNNDVKGVDAKENEDIAKDDKNNVQRVQANNGGTLGTNMSEASNGTDDTWKGAPYEPPKLNKQKDREPPKDSKRRKGIKYSKPWVKVRVLGTKTIPTDDFPFTVAAHHLIPGNASLYHKENKLKDYMIKNKTVKAKGKSWKIKYHVGYNVNGAHNGVWLPGNYAIRSGSSPTGVTWGKMGHKDWQLNYVAACVKVTKSQFHDAHTDYNDSVRELLNKISTKLNQHQCSCKLCLKKKGKKVPPPYRIKQRLYNLSRYFKNNLTLEPSQWRRPWFTSDRWRNVVFENNAKKPCKSFTKAYNHAVAKRMIK